MNNKKTSPNMASNAAKILNNSNASGIQQKLAGSVLSQANPQHQTSAGLEDIAAKVLSSPKYNDTTKSLAGSVLSQANKQR
jgi:hypothetical protein